MIPIMIVEDEFLVRVGLRTVIEWEKEGFQIVAEAQSAEEALELYEIFHPMIIITDIRLPKLDGIELMKMLKKQNSALSFIVISAYDDFFYAKESIDIGVISYILKGSINSNELKQTLKILHEKYSNQMNAVYLKQRYTIKDLYQNTSNSLQLQEMYAFEGKTTFFVYFITFKVNIQMLHTMIYDYFRHNHIESVSFSSDEGSWFLVSGKSKHLIKEELSNMINRYVDEKISVIISDDLTKYETVKEAVYHTILLYEYDKNKLDNKLIENSRKGNIAIIRKIEMEIQAMLKFQKYEGIKEQILLLKIEIIRMTSAKIFVDSIIRIVGIFSEYDDELNTNQMYDQIMESLNVAYIFECLLKFVEGIEKNSNNHLSNGYVLKAKEYIEKNYMKPIKVKEVADYIAVSPNYLGKIFFMETGDYLSDYISRIKIEKSKELLINQSEAIGIIAEKVGIEDQRYFSKLFKKYCGKTPREYQKENCK